MNYGIQTCPTNAGYCVDVQNGEVIPADKEKGEVVPKINQMRYFLCGMHVEQFVAQRFVFAEQPIMNIRDIKPDDGEQSCHMAIGIAKTTERSALNGKGD